MIEQRSLDTIFEEGLWPGDQGICPDPEADRRHTAIYWVLSRMPEEPFSWLADRSDTFQWFTPPVEFGAMICQFSPNIPGAVNLAAHARVLYLSPMLEHRSLDSVVATVAHELAHLVLEHAVLVKPQQYQAQEKEAWDLVRSWGFGRQARKRLAFYKRADTNDKKLIAKLQRQNEERLADSRQEIET